MADSNTKNKILLESRTTSYDPMKAMIPSYMRNANSILQAKEQMSKISWEIDGEKV